MMISHHETGIHHVEVNVSDLPRAEIFWGFVLERLGFQRYQRWERGVSWRSGSMYLVLTEVSDSYSGAPYHRQAVGLNHLAFHASSKGAVDQLMIDLRERGVTILYEDRFPHAGGKEHYALYCEDPDRIKVEIVAGGMASSD